MKSNLTIVATYSENIRDVLNEDGQKIYVLQRADARHCWAIFKPGKPQDVLMIGAKSLEASVKKFWNLDQVNVWLETRTLKQIK